MLERFVKKGSERGWQLVSGRLNDGAEILVLKMPTGEIFCEYAQGLRPHQKYWHLYYSGFAKRGFLSRETCIKDAERIAGHSLSVDDVETKTIDNFIFER